MTTDHPPPDVTLTQWLAAQNTAEAILTPPTTTVCRSSFEFRAAHDVLTLTLLFYGQDSTHHPPGPAELSTLRTLVTDDIEWAVWCADRLATLLKTTPSQPPLCAMRWLTNSRLLAGHLTTPRDPHQATATYHGVGVSIGVANARDAIDRALAAHSR